MRLFTERRRGKGRPTWISKENKKDVYNWSEKYIGSPTQQHESESARCCNDKYTGINNIKECFLEHKHYFHILKNENNVFVKDKKHRMKY